MSPASVESPHVDCFKLLIALMLSTEKQIPTVLFPKMYPAE